MDLTLDAAEEPLDRLLAVALETRRASFPPEVVFSAPSFKHYRSARLPLSGEPRFAALSVTGSRCELGCEHCGGRLLHAMGAAETGAALVARAAELAARGCRGLLISGGCDRLGSVPLAPLAPAIAEVRERLGLAVGVHAGLLDRATARALAEAGVERVMLDLVGSAETIRDVLHLEVGPEAFEEALATAIDAGLAAVPHVVVGLHRGRVVGERAAIAMAARHPVAALVLVVLRPEPGTGMAEVEPASPEAVARLLVAARLSLPSRPVLLGCARPVGAAGRAIEAFALRAGANGVAFPSDEAVDLALDLGLEPRIAESCCALPVGGI